jgi:HEAT repeat protein
MLDQAFDALKSYDWGVDPKVLRPIDDAVVARNGESSAKELEARLVAVLGSDASRDAKDYVCRKLRIIGTSSAVAALAKLLPDQELSHMARYALECMPASEAAQAMRDALSRCTGTLKVGVISSLGARRDAGSVEALSALLADGDAAVARAAALALGAIRTPEAAAALAKSNPSEPESKVADTDATLACAEGLLAHGKKVEALAVYKSLAGEGQPKHVRLAATSGILACARK